MSEQQVIKRTAKVWFGADPELFISLDGKIVGSEAVIPNEGIRTNEIRHLSATHLKDKGMSLGAVRDGVQVEFVIPASDCRAWFTMEVAIAFQTLKKRLDELKANGKPFEVSFRQVVEVDKEELAKLSADSRVLGCQPSFNFYEPAANIGVDPATYTKRSAGGHLHFGLPDALMSERDRLPPLFDIIIGNTSVLIDRDPNAAERRKVYGRAGEFRRPKHGIEYRTLSNFWLRSKELVSLVTGLGRLAIWILDTSVADKDNGGWEADKALVELVNIGNIKKAINENDVELAKKNFNDVRKFIQRHVPGNDTHSCGLDALLLNKFDKFVNYIDMKGLEYWFPTPPMEHWMGVGYNTGWEEFLLHTV